MVYGDMLRILLAEDDKNLGEVLKKEIEDKNCSIDLVHDGVQAVLYFIDRPYDLVLLDVSMSRLDGISALMIMKKINPRLRAIAFSGNANQEQIAEVLSRGAVKCLTKPFEIAELRRCIDKLGGTMLS
jgi:two-component system, cell cycle sensor histidine kinase and response regulator CckA